MSSVGAVIIESESESETHHTNMVGCRSPIGADLTLHVNSWVRYLLFRLIFSASNIFPGSGVIAVTNVNMIFI